MQQSIRIASVMALLFVGAASRADINLPVPVPVPPVADAQTDRVLRGERVAIELRGHYGGSGAIQFLIVRPPMRGKLSDLRASGNRAIITYTHDGSRAEDPDGFAYVVQAGGRVSSPAEVRIFVDEVPARLDAPEQIDFGEIVAGGSATRELPIKNAGGGVLEGSLAVSSPWGIAPGEYRVAAGETETATIAFRPNEAKKFVGQITLEDRAGGSTTVSLTGTATAAVRVSPNPLVFSMPQRREVVSLTNLTDATVHLQFQTSANLQPIDEISLSVREEKKVMVEVRSEVSGPLRETLTIAGLRFVVPLQIEAPGLMQPIVAKSEQPVLPHPSVPLTPAPTTTASEPVPVAASIAPFSDAAPSAMPNPLVKVTARRLTSSRWGLQWPAAKVPNASYRVEERLLSLDGSGELQTAWRPLAAAKLSATSDPVTAEIGGLNSRELHMLRVTALSHEGTEIWESFPVALAAPPERSHGRALWLLSLGGALAVFFFLRWRANRVSA